MTRLDDYLTGGGDPGSYSTGTCVLCGRPLDDDAPGDECIRCALLIASHEAARPDGPRDDPPEGSLMTHHHRAPTVRPPVPRVSPAGAMLAGALVVGISAAILGALVPRSASGAAPDPRPVAVEVSRVCYGNPTGPSRCATREPLPADTIAAALAVQPNALSDVFELAAR